MLTEDLYSRIKLRGAWGWQVPNVWMSRIFLPWIWRRYVPAKRRFIQDLQGATSQKTAFLKIEIVASLIHNNIQIPNFLIIFIFFLNIMFDQVILKEMIYTFTGSYKQRCLEWGGIASDSFWLPFTRCCVLIRPRINYSEYDYAFLQDE
jgi:hypothetical protein